MKELKAPDKVTQKMTRDGAVAENLATGEVTNISSREAETDLSGGNEPIATAEAAAGHIANAHERRTAKKQARAEAGTVREGSAARQRPSSRKVEQEKVGVEAGHKSEEVAELGVSYTGSKVKAAVHNHRMKPWRDATKAEQAAIRANADFLYQKAFHDDPVLAASTPVSRYLQKKRIQRNYAKEVHNAEKTAKNIAAAKSAAARAKEAAKKTVLFVKKHSKVILLVVGIGACVALLFGGISSCSMMAGSGVDGVFTSSYLSEDADMLAAEAAYCAMEAELQNELDNYESLHPGYDEYRFDLDEIEHDPYVLISILTAFHEGVFTIDQVQAELQMLFEKQYILTETVEVEVRYRTETDTWTDEDGNTHTDTYQVPYDYYICNVKLENFDLSHVPVYIMGEETLSLYATYMSPLGNREDLFPSSSYVGKYTNPPSTYDIPASALEDETFAALITEAEKYIGYPYDCFLIGTL